MTLKEKLTLILGDEGSTALMILLNGWDTEPVMRVVKNHEKLRRILVKYGERVKLRSRLAAWDNSFYKVGSILLSRNASKTMVLGIRLRILRSDLVPMVVDFPIDEFIDFLLNITEPFEEEILHHYLKSLPPPLKEIWLRKIRGVKERLSMLEKLLGETSSSFM